MNLYPVFINLKNKKCLVVGGGNVAERKITKLLNSEAKITVISPEITNIIKELAAKKQIKVKIRKYKKGDTKRKFMVIAATNSDLTNQKIYTECCKRNILLNAVDNPPNCNFYVPAIVQKGNLQIAISTSGDAPLLAKKIKKFIADKIQNITEADLLKLKNIRKTIIEKHSDNENNKHNAMQQEIVPLIDKLMGKLK